jgi:murein endopeptidase
VKRAVPPSDSEVIGFYSNGCVAGAQALPESGPTWQAMRLSRNRNWGHPELVNYITGLSRQVAATTSWNGLYVGDMSQPRGGPMLRSSHVSHQNGLDVDIWMLPARDLNLSVGARESLSSISIRSQRGAWINDNWTEDHAQVLRLAASDPRVERISCPPASRSGCAGTRPGTVTTSTGSGPSAATISISTCGSPVLPGRNLVRSRSRPHRAMAAPRQKPAAPPF